MVLDGKIVLLGDLHFGIKKGSIEFFDNQMAFFEKQLFPYLKKHKIKQIFQFGDFMDTRTNANINIISELRRRLFDVLKKNDIIMYSLVGNHDIYYKESREVTLIEHFADMYPDNFIVFRDRETITINKQEVLVLPWITENDNLTMNDIKGRDYIFGHLEIRNFQVVKGHLDETSKLTPNFFAKSYGLKGVYSGHYHIKSSNGLISYLGTPYSLTWADYDEDKGFYIWNEDESMDFISNTESKKFIKLKFNIDNKNPLEISGLGKRKKNCSIITFKKEVKNLKGHEIKFFVNKSTDNTYDEYLYVLKENGIPFTIINNQFISELIETDFVDDTQEEMMSSRELILKTIKEDNPNVVPLLNEIFAELDSVKLSEE